MGGVAAVEPGLPQAAALWTTAALREHVSRCLCFWAFLTRLLYAGRHVLAPLEAIGILVREKWSRVATVQTFPWQPQSTQQAFLAMLCFDLTENTRQMGGTLPQPGQLHGRGN